MCHTEKWRKPIRIVVREVDFCSARQAAILQAFGYIALEDADCALYP